MAGEFVIRVTGDVRDVLAGLKQTEQAAETSAGRIGQSFNKAFNRNTASGLAAELERISKIQGRVRLEGVGFEVLERRLQAIKELQAAIERKKLLINVESGSIADLQNQLGSLNQQLAKVAIGSKAFRDLQSEIRGVEKELSRVAQSNNLKAFNRNTISGLAAELERLSRIQGRVRVEGAGFEAVERRLQSVRTLQAAIERKKLLITADSNSVAALSNRLETLREKLNRVAIGGRVFQKLQRDIRDVEQELARAGESGERAARGTGLLRSALSGLAGLAAGASITGFVKSSVDAAVDLEVIGRKLSNTLGPQGAQAALGFTRGLADRLGLSFSTLASNFGSFTAAATAANVPLETQRGLFAAVAQAGQALGLSNDEIGGSLLALQQVASKGTVAMEELRGQLGERLPIALSATARGLGISQRELIKLVETGRLSAGEFFPALTKGLNELTSAAGGVPTAAQNFQKLDNAWKDLQQTFGKNLLPGITATVLRLAEALNELKVQSRGGELGLGRGLLPIKTESAQLVGELDRLQNKFNLTDKQAQALFTDAVAGAKGTYDAFGRLNLSAEQYAKILDTLPSIVEKWRAKNRDTQTEVIALAAAENARLEGLRKLADAQQKAIASQGRSNRVALIAAEVDQIRRLTDGTISQVKIEEEQFTLKRQQLREEIQAYDLLLTKLEAAGSLGEDYKKAAEARSQVVLAAAKNEEEAFRKTEERVRARIAQERELSGAIRARPSQLAGDQLQLGQALLNYSQATNELEQNRYNIAVARGREELDNLQQSGASQQVIRDKQQEIAVTEREALVARYQGLLQVQAIEQRMLELRQAQARVEAETGVLDAQARLLQQQLELRKAIRTGDQQEVQSQQALVTIAALGVDSASRKLALLQAIAPLEQGAVDAQRQSAREAIQAEALTRGWGNAISAAEDAYLGVRQEIVQVGKDTYELRNALSDQGDAAREVGQGYQDAVSPAAALNQYLQDSKGLSIDLQDSMFKVSEVTGQSATSTQAMATAMGIAAQNAKAYYDWIFQAASVPRGLFTGGPAVAGTTYRVNELGRESFLSTAGRLTEINRPANALWTPPSNGTVIPAGITAQLRERGMLQRGPGLAAGFRGDGGMAAMAVELGMLRQEVRALRLRSWDVGVRVINEAGGATLIDRMNSLI